MEDVITPAGSYTNRRWIGLAPAGGECPPTDGWQAERLVDLKKLPAKAGADKALLHQLGLDRFCVYTPTFPFGVPDPPANPTAQMDRLALSSSGLEDTITPILAGHFLGQAGYSTLPLPSAASPSVRLTFIDSQPTDDEIPAPAPPGSQHGYTLGQLARRLVCSPAGACAATVASRRALSFGDFDPRQPLPSQPLSDRQSGHVGLVSELAQAIVDEVVHWQDTGDRRHLILNLSLGWDGEILHDIDQRRVSRLDPAVQAVYAALRYARLRGALVIAAAGNRSGAPTASQWPLLPAAWEMRRPWPWPFVLGPKLVYAVGGVDWQGLPLPNYRHGGRPRRVAYGDHAAAEVTGQPPTAIYTGSSVSAAVVSSIAAVIWHLRPELTPAEVMKLISRSGDRLETRADVYPWRDLWLLDRLLPHPRMQRASLCAAVRRACGPGARHCRSLTQPLPACPAWERQAPELKDLFAAAKKPIDFTEVSTVPRPCNPRARYLITGDVAPVSFCPTDQFVSAASRRWVLPQPEDDPCPGCTLLPKPPGFYTLVMEMGDAWRENHSAADIKGAMLTIDCPRGDRTTRTYAIPFLFDPTVGQQTVSTAEAGTSLEGCRAQIDFTVQKEETLMSIQNPVIVDP
jgi:hypothetical protein